ncbi:hypothetical protein [Methylobacterium sp. Leaf106]|uniref:hypothetical protein n=1 Tax=Methylobacterium sp. Leaf106 TaxID=1736255 RepID=UPI0006FF63C0|nr:hypothetical protein [Methylobacterium sp. Leaf106]KQP53017.1 hypothetical protein ASF34_01195 [Methylobacterium sp. Leaf106]
MGSSLRTEDEIQTKKLGDLMPDNPITHGLIHSWPDVGALQVLVMETVDHPRTLSVSVVGGPYGEHTIAEIDSTEPGSRAKAISLGDTVNTVLEAAFLGWFTPEDEIDVTKR